MMMVFDELSLTETSWKQKPDALPPKPTGTTGCTTKYVNSCTLGDANGAKVAPRSVEYCKTAWPSESAVEEDATYETPMVAYPTVDAQNLRKSAAAAFKTPVTRQACEPEKNDEACTAAARPDDAVPDEPTAPPVVDVEPESKLHSATTAPGEPLEVHASPAYDT